MCFFRYASGQTDIYTDPESDTLIVVLTPLPDEFEGQGQRSKVRSSGTKNGIFRPFRRPA